MKLNEVKEAFAKNNVAIVLCSSNYYVPYLTVVINSIIKSGSQVNNYDVLIINREIEDYNREIVVRYFSSYKNLSIRFIDIEQSLEDCNYNYRDGYVAESFYRVIMMNMLSNYKKVVYLDCDLVVTEDIANLFNEDLGGCFAGVVRDPAGIGWCSKNHDGRKEYMISVLGLKSIRDYFQSGVMLFNLEVIREKYDIKQIIQAASNPEIVWGDQDVLNQLFAGRVKYLNPAWNTIVNNARGTQIHNFVIYADVDTYNDYMKARRNPFIIHYAGTKPWADLNVDYGWIFWQYARKTPFYQEIIERDLGK